MVKIAKSVIKGMLYFIASVLGLLLLYILFNLNLFHHTKPLLQAELQTLQQNIDPATPAEYVAGKFDNADVVFIGELHKRKQDLAFFNGLIAYLYKTKGINIIGWEFGAADYQKEADSIVTASAFDRKKAIAIMRRSNYYWCYEDYLTVFKTIWQVNKSIPAGRDKIKFLQLNKPFVPRRWDAADDAVRFAERKTSFDNILPAIVEKEVLDRHKKILIYCGLHHSFTRFKTPKLFFMRENEGRAGELLANKYPGKVFQICLVSPFPPRWLVYKEAVHTRHYAYVYPFDGVFNQLYEKTNRPFCVDASNVVLGKLRDYNSFYAFDKAAGITLNSFCDGYIMPDAFDKIQPVDIIPDWITTQTDLNEVKNILPEADAAHITTIEDALNYINPAGDLQEIKNMHNLKKFW